jgi:hypothetical protein
MAPIRQQADKSTTLGFGKTGNGKGPMSVIGLHINKRD